MQLLHCMSILKLSVIGKISCRCYNGCTRMYKAHIWLQILDLIAQYNYEAILVIFF